MMICGHRGGNLKKNIDIQKKFDNIKIKLKLTKYRQEGNIEIKSSIKQKSQI